MSTPKLPIKSLKYSSSVFLQTRRNYLVWHWSATIATLAVTAFLIFQGYSIYHQSMDLINVSNAKIIEKTGIEIITKLNKQQLEQAEQIILKKNRPFGTPQRVRNIFLFDAYTDLSSAQPEEIFPVAD